VQTQEADILERLRARNPTAGQQPNVIQLLDSFEHTSANGIHQVLLTETVLPFLTDFNNGYSKFEPRVTKDQLRPTIEGLAYIHSHGIAHGGSALFSSALQWLPYAVLCVDLYPSNVGIAIPEFDQFSGL
jgi:serine/threonine protein kinase